LNANILKLYLPCYQNFNFQFSKTSSNTTASTKSKWQVHKWMCMLRMRTLRCRFIFQPTLWNILFTFWEKVWVVTYKQISDRNVCLKAMGYYIKNILYSDLNSHIFWYLITLQHHILACRTNCANSRSKNSQSFFYHSSQVWQIAHIFWSKW
jgi:hypothetical protein